jgi:hypothetical protein
MVFRAAATARLLVRAVVVVVVVVLMLLLLMPGHTVALAPPPWLPPPSLRRRAIRSARAGHGGRKKFKSRQSPSPHEKRAKLRCGPRQHGLARVPRPRCPQNDESPTTVIVGLSLIL